MKWLVDDYKNWWRWWSVRLQLFGTTLLTLLEAFPDAFVSIYATLPPDIAAAIPPGTLKYIGYATIAAGTIARVIKQSKLHEDASLGPESKP